MACMALIGWNTQVFMVESWVGHSKMGVGKVPTLIDPAACWTEIPKSVLDDLILYLLCYCHSVETMLDSSAKCCIQNEVTVLLMEIWSRVANKEDWTGGCCICGELHFCTRGNGLDSFVIQLVIQTIEVEYLMLILVGLLCSYNKFSYPNIEWLYSMEDCGLRTLANQAGELLPWKSEVYSHTIPNSSWASL